MFFKCAKSLLRLQKEFQGRSYDLLISHTTIVFSRYILMAWQHRQSTGQRILGGLFYLLCDEVGSLDWAVSLQQLVELLNEIATQVGKKLSTMIKKSTPTLDLGFAKLHQGLPADSLLRKLSI